MILIFSACVFAATGITVDASQEMMTLGLCNIIGSCCKSMPTCGAFTRSAVSSASGVKTPMAGLYSSIMAVLALSLLTPYFYFIPKATLAAVLVIAVMFMVSHCAKYMNSMNAGNFPYIQLHFALCLSPFADRS